MVRRPLSRAATQPAHTREPSCSTHCSPSQHCLQCEDCTLLCLCMQTVHCNVHLHCKTAQVLKTVSWDVTALDCIVCSCAGEPGGGAGHYLTLSAAWWSRQGKHFTNLHLEKVFCTLVRGCSVTNNTWLDGRRGDGSGWKHRCIQTSNEISTSSVQQWSSLLRTHFIGFSILTATVLYSGNQLACTMCTDSIKYWLVKVNHLKRLHYNSL